MEWYEMPKPPKWHRCKASTSGFAYGYFVERCACGAIRFAGYKVWINKNSRT